MAKEPKQASNILGQAGRLLAPLLQLGLFEHKHTAALNALAELEALEQRLKGDQNPRLG
jgi:hypothetical protein